MSHKINGYHLPSQDEIAYCAFLIWEKEGRPPGRAKEYWLQAETQLTATRAHDGRTESASQQIPSDPPRE